MNSKNNQQTPSNLASYMKASHPPKPNVHEFQLACEYQQPLQESYNKEKQNMMSNSLFIDNIGSRLDQSHDFRLNQQSRHSLSKHNDSDHPNGQFESTTIGLQPSSHLLNNSAYKERDPHGQYIMNRQTNPDSNALIYSDINQTEISTQKPNLNTEYEIKEQILKRGHPINAAISDLHNQINREATSFDSLNRQNDVVNSPITNPLQLFTNSTPHLQQHFHKSNQMDSSYEVTFAKQMNNQENVFSELSKESGLKFKEGDPSNFHYAKESFENPNLLTHDSKIYQPYPNSINNPVISQHQLFSKPQTAEIQRNSFDDGQLVKKPISKPILVPDPNYSFCDQLSNKSSYINGNNHLDSNNFQPYINMDPRFRDPNYERLILLERMNQIYLNNLSLNTNPVSKMNSSIFNTAPQNFSNRYFQNTPLTNISNNFYSQLKDNGHALSNELYNSNLPSFYSYSNLPRLPHPSEHIHGPIYQNSPSNIENSYQNLLPHTSNNNPDSFIQDNSLQNSFSRQAPFPYTRQIDTETSNTRIQNKINLAGDNDSNCFGGFTENAFASGKDFEVCRRTNNNMEQRSQSIQPNPETENTNSNFQNFGYLAQQSNPTEKAQRANNEDLLGKPKQLSSRDFLNDSVRKQSFPQQNIFKKKAMEDYVAMNENLMTQVNDPNKQLFPTNSSPVIQNISPHLHLQTKNNNVINPYDTVVPKLTSLNNMRPDQYCATPHENIYSNRIENSSSFIDLPFAEPKLDPKPQLINAVHKELFDMKQSNNNNVDFPETKDNKFGLINHNNIHNLTYSSKISNEVNNFNPENNAIENANNLILQDSFLNSQLTEPDQAHSQNFQLNADSQNEAPAYEIPTSINNSIHYPPESSDNFENKNDVSMNDLIAEFSLLSLNSTIQLNLGSSIVHNKHILFDTNRIIHFVKIVETLENGFFVDKYQITDNELVRLSKLISVDPNNGPIQFDNSGRTVVNFEQLQKFEAKFVGIFGRLHLITKCLTENKFVKDSEAPYLEKHLRSQGSGLYLYALTQQTYDLKFLLILHASDDDFDNVHNKKEIIQLLRYMTQLCNTNILAIDKSDVDRINFESENQISRPTKFVPQTIKKDEDRCEILRELSWKPSIQFKRLIGTGSNVGFYIKTFFDEKKNTVKLRYEWKSASDYNTYFSKCQVSIDRLVKTPPVTLMENFLIQNFNKDFAKIEKLVKDQLGEYLEANKMDIEERINHRVDVQKCFYTLQAMKFYAPHEYECLRNTQLHSIFNSELAKKIEKALTKKHDVNDAHKKQLQLMFDKISDGFLLETDLKALSYLINTNSALKGFNLNEYLRTANLLSKSRLYQKIADKKNSECYFFTKMFYPWYGEQIRRIIDYKIKSDKFYKKHQAELMRDMKTLFIKLYAAIDEFISFESFRLELRDSISKSQLEKLRECFYLNLLKEKLQKQSGKTYVYIESISLIGNKNSEKIIIEYEKVDIIQAHYEFDIYQFNSSKHDSDNIIKDKSYVIKPKHNKVTKVSLPAAFEVVECFLMKSRRFAVVLNKVKGSELIFYDVSNLHSNPMISYFGNQIHKCDYNESENKIVFFSETQGNATIILYFISDNFLMRNDATVDLENRFGIKKVKCMRLGKSNEVFLIDDQNMIRKIDCKNSTGEKIERKGDNIIDMVFVTNTNCLLFMSKTSIIPYIVHSKTFLPEIVFQSEFDNCNFILAKFDSQIQLMSKIKDTVDIKLLNCVLNNENYGLVKCSFNSKNKNPQTKNSLSVFDYFKFMYEKYAVYYPLQKVEKQNVSQILMTYLSGCSSSDISIVARIKQKLEEIQSHIKKPFAREMGLTQNSMILFAENDNSKLLNNTCYAKNLNLWVQELICLVPTQISRCENNQYIILNKGLPMKLHDLNTLYDVKDSINFGLYECIFNNWEKDIKVITSMGKQSTGKSYTLNHLSGSTFSIAGGRCTDGCWLSIRITDDCLYVLMDFEGLGSFERSEQEDMLLSIQNASISNLTIFKAEASINKDTDRMFNRFNQGANMLKGDNTIFQGTFCIMVKDIFKTDVDDITNEFMQKMNTIIEREQKKDFITTMYKSGYLIWPFPPLANGDYFDEMKELDHYIKNEIQSTFTNGKDFLNMLKTIMAKMTIEDFTSLNQQEINHRIHILNQLYIDAFTWGKVVNSKEAQNELSLKSFDVSTRQISEEIALCLQLLNGEIIEIKYKDTDIDLNNGSKDFIHILNCIYKKSSTNHIQWSEFLRSFMKQGVEKRIARVLEWIDVNLEKWNATSDFQEIVANFKNLVSYKAKEIQTVNQICKHTCESCNSGCVLLINHCEKHACESSDHKCQDNCSYCLNENSKVNCELPFGHLEKHACSTRQHTCGLDCRYELCKNKCIEKTGHEGEHKCATKQHNCSQNCSLEECKNRCQISADKEHTIHKCVNDQCMKTCEVQSCKLRCACNNHFHGVKELSLTFKAENQIETTSDFMINGDEEINCDFHCCGNDHKCEEICVESGFCHVIHERKIVEKEFQGQRGTFHFQKQFENIGSKLTCCINIPKFKRTHDGKHLHTLDESYIHSCTVRCPTCNNICEKPFGHTGKHHTTHGNMENSYFISDQNDFDIGDHKYVVGESSVAEMCHMFCNKLGRGHIHVISCNETAELCNNKEEGKRRHETCQYGPDFTNTKDEIKHEAYWELINFEDPCLQIDIETFSKCPFYCGHEDHKSDDEKQYCQLDLWHDKARSLQAIKKDTGTVSYDGHYFNCSHISGKGYHFVLCLDRSGSMNGQPWNDLTHSVKSFCSSRKFSTLDRLSIILFTGSTKVMCENILFNEFCAIRHLIYKGGTTDFGKVIKEATNIFKKNIYNSLIPILVFMSDGHCENGDREIKILKNEFESKGLRSFFIGFTTQNFLSFSETLDCSNPKLQEFATLTNGEYFTSVDGIQLKTTFMDISSKFGTTISVMKSHK